LIAAMLLAATPARAADDDESPSTATPDAEPPGYTLRPELQLGADAPLGTGSLSAVYGPRPWLSFGAGLGTTEHFLKQLNYGLFVRAHALRRGVLKLGPAVTVARADYRHRTEIHDAEVVTWIWQPAYRLDVGAGFEARQGRWSGRLEGGLGFVLSDPTTCEYSVSPATTFYRGACEASAVPPQYRSAPTAGVVRPYFALSIGVDVQPDQSPARGAETSGWYGGPAVWADLAFLTVGGLGVYFGSELSLYMSAAVYALGGPINHVAHGHTWRGFSSFGLRAAGALLTAAAVVGLSTCLDESSNCAAWVVLLPIGPLAAMIIDDAFLAQARGLSRY
jgi:hypothetical protein